MDFYCILKVTCTISEGFVCICTHCDSTSFGACHGKKAERIFVLSFTTAHFNYGNPIYGRFGAGNAGGACEVAAPG